MVKIKVEVVKIYIFFFDWNRSCENIISREMRKVGSVRYNRDLYRFVAWKW